MASQPIVELFFEMLHTIKLYHWKTISYAQHKATDELHEKLSENTDKFVEIMIGKIIKDDGRMPNQSVADDLSPSSAGKLPTSRDRVQYRGDSIPIYDFQSKQDFVKKLEHYISMLQDFNNRFDSKIDSDLLNIRDEMSGDINQTLYLFSLE
jgi:hypothetical protein